MFPSAPEQIRLNAGALTELEAVLRAAAPEEGCALLLGRRDLEIWWLERIWPCRNAWQPASERRHRFALDPREQLQAQVWARGQGLEVLGAAHSHPDGLAIPSATDRQLTPLPSLMLILGLDGLACWWLDDPGLPPQRLPWEPLLAAETQASG
ncbi:MAG: M67 family metallopeptidase [Synechococcaceae cyanobacterium]